MALIHIVELPGDSGGSENRRVTLYRSHYKIERYKRPALWADRRVCIPALIGPKLRECRHI